MHPSKFMGRVPATTKPPLSEAERAERLQALSAAIAGKRREAVDARKASGIEDTWLACEEAYIGIDDANRHEFAKAKWAKPMSMSGGLTALVAKTDNTRSTAFVRLTARYVDNATAKLGEILLPVDDKAFSFEPTPDPDLVKIAQQGQPAAPMPAQPQYGAPSPQALAQAAGQPTVGQTQPAQDAQVPPQVQADADAANAILNAAKDAAKKAETRIYDWMVEAKYPAECRKVIHDAARLGAGVLKGPFPDEQENRAAVKTANGYALEIQRKLVPSVKWVDLWNLFPADGCGEDIRNGDYLLERDFLSTKMLKNLKGQEGYLDDQIDEVLEEGPGKSFTEGSNPSADQKNKKRFEIWYYYGLIKRADLELANAPGLEELGDDVEEVHAIVSMVNDRIIRAVLHPLESGSFPYRIMCWSRRAGHWAGVGVGEQMAMPQRSVNAATRALFNNAGLSSGVQVIVDQEALTPADGSWVITPNKVWYTKAGMTVDVTKAFNILEVPSTQAALSAIIEYGMKLAEESTGIPLITQGQTGPTSPETFGQAELQDNNAHTWLRSIGYRFDDEITEPLVRDFYEWLLVDPSVPDDEKGDFRINAKGSIAMVERAIQEMVLMNLLNASANPAFKLNPAKLIALYLKAKRLDPRDVQYSEQEQQQMAQQPPPPPVQVQVAQVNGQNKLQQIQMQAQADAQQAEQEAAREQQLLAQGGAAPHQVAAMAAIEREKIRAETSATIQASRAQAELARAEKEQQIAAQNGAYDLQKMQLQKEIALIDLAIKQNISIEQAKADLAKAAMQETTKRNMAAAEIQLAQSEGAADRQHDANTHLTSLIRDQVSTDNTP